MQSRIALNLAKNVARLKEERGWSQRELAVKAKLSQSGVGFVLRYKDQHDRHASLDTIEALADAFGVSPISLLTEHGTSHLSGLDAGTLTRTTAYLDEKGAFDHPAEVFLEAFVAAYQWFATGKAPPPIPKAVTVVLDTRRNRRSSGEGEGEQAKGRGARPARRVDGEQAPNQHGGAGKRRKKA